MAGDDVVESLGLDRIGSVPFRPFIVVLAGAAEAHGVVLAGTRGNSHGERSCSQASGFSTCWPLRIDCANMPYS
jgi:hypothetical protein